MAAVAVVVESVVCRLISPTVVLDNTPDVVGRGAMGSVVGKPPRPPRPPSPPSPKGQLIVVAAVTVLEYLVRVYGTVVVASVVSRYAKVDAH